MQRFIVYLKNKIFISLTIILLFSIFFIMRECDYPLLFHSKLVKLIFVPKYTEKLFYNLSLSYIAAYIFYVIQIFIPQTLTNKKAYHILIKDFEREYRLTKEFLFLVNQIIIMTENSEIHYKSDMSPIYFKEIGHNTNILKRFSKIDTLEQLVKDIHHQFMAIENSKYYNELDSYIIKFHSLFPLTEIQECLECINYSFESANNLNVVSDDLISPIEQFLNQMAHIMPKFTEIDMIQCTDRSLNRKYDNAIEDSGLNECKFGLLMKEKADDINRAQRSGQILTDNLI